MKAVRFHDRGDIRFEDVPKPRPRPGEVLIEVEWCGLCGTDLHEYEFGPILIPRPEQPHASTGGYLPVTLGHEFCGRIVETTEGSGFKVGEAVMVDPRINCTKCHRCQNDVEQLCDDFGFVGLSGNHGGGGFSELAAVEARMCHRLPEDVKFDEAALIEPLAVGRHALSQAGIDDFGDKTALVIGGGPIGLSVVWNLRAKGAKLIIVSEPSAVRREHSEGIAHEIVDPSHTDVTERCRALTQSLGVHLVFDCAGAPAGMTAGMAALRARGAYIVLAGWMEPMIMPMVINFTKELTTKFSMAYDNADYKAVVSDFIAGKFAGVERMITSRVYLEDLTEAFHEIIENKDRHVKVIATPKRQLIN